MKLKFLVCFFLLLNGIQSCSSKKAELFDFNQYEEFISKIANNDSILIVPLKNFNGIYDSTKVIVGIRHDVDNDIFSALKMAKIEFNYNIQSTYFILHTAQYYRKGSNNFSGHNENILGYISQLQNSYFHEIGIHNDLVTLQLIYDINSKEFLHNEINWLRHNGINIYGTAAHGSKYAEQYKYLNIYFFKERSKVKLPYLHNDSIIINNKKKFILKGTFEEYNLSYEAYDLHCNKYYSDRYRSDGRKWNPNFLQFQNWRRGDRIMLLIHPVF